MFLESGFFNFEYFANPDNAGGRSGTSFLLHGKEVEEQLFHKGLAALAQFTIQEPVLNSRKNL